MAKIGKGGKKEIQVADNHGPWRTPHEHFFIQRKAPLHTSGWSIFLLVPVTLFILCASQCSPWKQARESRSNLPQSLGNGGNRALVNALEGLAIPTLKGADKKQICQFPKADGRRQMNVFVTGAVGFIGMHLALELKAKNHIVIGMDNFNNLMNSTSLKVLRYHELLKAGIPVLLGDLNDSEQLVELFSTCHFTHIANLAAQAGVRYSLENPSACIDSNIKGFISLLESLRHSSQRSMREVPKVLHASSSSVYGDSNKVSFAEADSTDRPLSLYAASKKADEVLAHTYHHIFNISFVFLRFFTVYGPFGRPDMSYFKFARSIAEGKVVRIYKDQTGKDLERDFTCVDDIVQGCLGALNLLSRTDEAMFSTYNLGSGSPVAVGKLVDVLESLMGRHVQRRYLKVDKDGDMRRTFANISAARQDLGYSPVHTIDSGVAQFVQWFNKYYRED